MRLEKPIIRERAADPEQCIHHWLLDTGSDGVAEGVCKLCGAKREFTWPEKIPRFGGRELFGRELPERWRTHYQGASQGVRETQK